MDNNTSLVYNAEISYDTCKAYSQKLAAYVKETVFPSMQRNDIDFNKSVFADIQIQPVFCQDSNPYKTLMNVLDQFAGVVAGAYDATIRLECAKTEIDRLTQEFY